MNSTHILHKRNPRTQPHRSAPSPSLYPTVDPQIGTAKDSIRSEFREKFSVSEHLLDLALNEAEALAWETGFPYLFFPTLAREKLQALDAWSMRQKSLRHTKWERHFAE
jgi:hypothetical protein